MKDGRKNNRSNLVDKKVARVVFDELRGWRTNFPQAFHEVIDHAARKAAVIRGSSVCLTQMIIIEKVANLGLYAGINGKNDWKVTLPDRLNRRWKVVAQRALRVGIEYAQAKEAGYVPSVPKACLELHVW